MTQASDLTRIPPHNLDAEKAVLGSILLDPEAIAVAAGILTPPDFYSTPHQRIFEAMLTLWHADTPIDLMILYNELRKVEQLEEIGGLSYLTSLEQCVMSTANIKNHCIILKQKSKARALIAATHQAIDRLYREDWEDPPDGDLYKGLGGVSSVFDELEATMIDIRDGQTDKPALAAMPILDFIRAKDEFAEVRSLWGGRIIAKNEIALLSAPPKIGKSWWCQQLVICLATGKPFLGLETGEPCRAFYLQAEIAELMLLARFVTQIEQFLADADSNVHELLNQNLRVSIHARSFHLWSDADKEAAGNLTRLQRLLDDFEPDLLVLDPLSQILRCDESDTRAVAEALAIVDRIITRYGCAVLLVHHWPKEQIANMARSGGPNLMVASRGAGKWNDYVSSVLNLHYPNIKQRGTAILDFTLFRNRPDLDPIWLKRPCAECLFFERIDTPPEAAPAEQKKIAVQARKGYGDLLNILSFGPKSHAQIVRELVEDKHACKKRTACTLIAEAVDAGILVQDLAGHYRVGEE